MGPKKRSSNSIGMEKIKVMRTTVELKDKVITKFENSVRVSVLTVQYNMAKYTISAFLKNKAAIKAADVAKGVTIVHSRQMMQIMDEVEKLLLIWIREK